MNAIPAGYRKNARGDLIQESTIKPIDLARDELVLEIVEKARKLSAELARLKAEFFGDIEAFVQMSAEQYDVNLGGKKGNLSLLSFDGQYKVIRANADNIVFDERLYAAKELIDQCLRDWSKDAHPGLLAMVNDAFRADRDGELRTARVLALRRHNIDDPRWHKAMDAISDALQVVGSKSYIRVHERIAGTEQYRLIPLDIAGV
ncbi:MAG: DUF3164 family protein [Pseudohongiella nitratireducens]|nr:DUF3164 family protein [Pseudohongiella nitratireducens]MDF1622497.1 DUF3164 family protein [Pseudohongiella nitratireducens]